MSPAARWAGVRPDAASRGQAASLLALLLAAEIECSGGAARLSVAPVLLVRRALRLKRHRCAAALALAVQRIECDRRSRWAARALVVETQRSGRAPRLSSALHSGSNKGAVSSSRLLSPYVGGASCARCSKNTWQVGWPGVRCREHGLMCPPC